MAHQIKITILSTGGTVYLPVEVPPDFETKKQYIKFNMLGRELMFYGNTPVRMPAGLNINIVFVPEAILNKIKLLPVYESNMKRFKKIWAEND